MNETEDGGSEMPHLESILISTQRITCLKKFSDEYQNRVMENNSELFL